MIRWLSFICMLLFPLLGFGAMPTWDIVPAESEITFTGMQNNAPISGKFTRFSAKISGDIDQLQKSHVVLTVDATSIDLSFGDLEDALKASEWLNVELFQTATFFANKFVKLSARTYQAKGTLIIKNKRIPLNATFVILDYTPKKARIKGSLVLKRSMYDVGSGEWGNAVGDEVRVHYVLTAVKR